MVQQDIERAVAILRRGGLVAFPTETVYGLGADAQRAVAPIGSGRIRPVAKSSWISGTAIGVGRLELLCEDALDVCGAAHRAQFGDLLGGLTLGAHPQDRALAGFEEGVPRMLGLVSIVAAYYFMGSRSILLSPPSSTRRRLARAQAADSDRCLRPQSSGHE